MSATNDQIDSPRQAVEDAMPNVENNEISKPAALSTDERPPVDLKLNEKEDKEDYWVIWGQLVNDWNNQYKKNTQYVKVGANLVDIFILLIKLEHYPMAIIDR